MWTGRDGFDVASGESPGDLIKLFAPSLDALSNAKKSRRNSRI